MRAFVGARLPAAAARELDQWTADLRARWPARAVRWVPAQNMHLTLRFLGESAAEKLEALQGALAELGEQSNPLALIESRLHKEGAEYRALYRVKLAGR